MATQEQIDEAMRRGWIVEQVTLRAGCGPAARSVGVYQGRYTDAAGVILGRQGHTPAHLLDRVWPQEQTEDLAWARIVRSIPGLRLA